MRSGLNCFVQNRSTASPGLVRLGGGDARRIEKDVTVALPKSTGAWNDQNDLQFRAVRRAGPAPVRGGQRSQGARAVRWKKNASPTSSCTTANRRNGSRSSRPGRRSHAASSRTTCSASWAPGRRVRCWSAKGVAGGKESVRVPSKRASSRASPKNTPPKISRGPSGAVFPGRSLGFRPPRCGPGSCRS
jgi:hypothetical protein